MHLLEFTNAPSVHDMNKFRCISSAHALNELHIFFFPFLQINEAIGFLHNLGSLQHFANDYLKSKVVINPQWIVDVMACVVSVRSNAIEVSYNYFLFSIENYK